MAKISPVSIKYIIHAKLEAEGTIEKPDIIGAIFGQTEGLLGEELEMRELQKSGKIGRIEVNVSYDSGKTMGEIEVPSALNKTETTIIAAALETIERVGPSDTKIIIEDIEDIRGSKRDYILDRAKKLMERFGEERGDMDEMTNEIQDSAKAARIQTYGTENLPCGDVSGDELIIVEGRADVVNLLKKGIKNVIAMDGSKLPESIKTLSREKGEVTLFVDGDRGGNLIIKNVVENAKIDFIAMAPEGKEVEELTGKEALQALRKKVPASEYQEAGRGRGVKRYEERGRYEDRRGGYDNRRGGYEDRNRGYDNRREERRYEEPIERKVDKTREIKKITSKEKDKIRGEIDELIGTKGALVFNKELEVVKKVPLNRLPGMRFEEEPYIIAIDGTATKRVVEGCEDIGCHNLIASNFVYADTNINLVSM